MSYIVNAANKRTKGPVIGNTAEPVAHQASAANHVSTVVKTTTKQSFVTQKPVEDRSISTAISIISQESGIAIQELTDDTRFDDIGVDSLLGLMVSSRIRDELGLDVESNAFLEVRTVGSFKKFLGGLVGMTDQLTTVTETIKEEVMPVAVPSLFSENINKSTDTWPNVLAILSEESGIDVNELTGDTNFSDIGVDSLLSLVVVSRMRDELNLDIPDQSLFLDFPTVESLKARITGALQVSSSDSELSDSDVSTDVSSVFSPGLDAETPFDELISPVPIVQTLPPVKPAWSIVLQGSPRNATERLFLFPDGCGAATSYLKLPTLSPSTAVIAFNSPFMKYVVVNSPLQCERLI
jgi:acyl carrier protein